MMQKASFQRKIFISFAIFLMVNLVLAPLLVIIKPAKVSAEDSNALGAEDQAEINSSNNEDVEGLSGEEAASFEAESNALTALNTISAKNDETASFTQTNLLGQKIILDAADREILNAYLTPDLFSQTMEKGNTQSTTEINDLFDLAFNPQKIEDLMADKTRNPLVRTQLDKIIVEKLEIKNITPENKALCADLFDSQKDADASRLEGEDVAASAARDARVASRENSKENNSKLCVASVLQNTRDLFASAEGKNKEQIASAANEASAQLKFTLKEPWWRIVQTISGEIIKTIFQPLSVRTAEALVYLVTPKNLGGAGHESIKVSIWNSPSIDNAEKGSASVDRHKDGMAFDIEAADAVRCTLIESGWFRERITPQTPPLSLEMAYQSESGLATSKEFAKYTGALHNAITNAAAANWLQILGVDSKNINLDAFRQGDFGSMAKGIGLQVLINIVNSPVDGLKGFSLNDIVESTARGMLADYLGLPAEALEGTSLDAVQINTGRVTLEEKMDFPLGSLKGETPNEIFAAVGQRKVEMLLKLRADSLKGASPGTPDNLRALIGQMKLEDAINLPKGTLDNNDVTEFKKRILPQKWEYLKTTSNQLDEALHLPYGTSQQLFFSANPDLARFKWLIGNKTLDEELLIYRKNKEINKPDPQDDKTEEMAWGIKPPTSTTIHFKDRVPESGEIIKRFKQGDFSIFEEIGMSELANALTRNLIDQKAMIEWFNSNGATGSYPEDTMRGRLDLEEGEFARLFTAPIDQLNTKTQINSVFRDVGRKRLIDAVKETAPVSEEVKAIEQEISFYTDRIEIIRDNRNRIKQIVNNNKTQSYYTAEEREALDQIEKAINDVSGHPSINNAKAASKKIRTALDTLEARNAVRGERTDLPDEVKAQLKSDYEEIKVRINNINHAIREILAGETLDRDPSSVSGGANNLAAKKKKWQLDPRDVLDLITGKKNWRQFLQQVGLSQLESEFYLPKNSLYYFINQNGEERGPNALTESIGQATIEKELRLPANTFSGQNLTEIGTKIDIATSQKGGLQKITQALQPPEQIDSKFKIERGSTAKLLAGEISPTDYKLRVGREAEKVTALEKINEQSGGKEILGYRLSGEDLYNILSGNLTGVTAKIGGYKLEQKFDLYPGAGLAFINAKSNSERLDIIVNNGFSQWARYLGIARKAQLYLQYLDTKKEEQNAAQNLGQARIEEMLGLLPNTFYGNLDEVYTRNNGWLFATAFHLPIDDIISSSELSKLISQSYLVTDDGQPIPAALAAAAQLDALSVKLRERFEAIKNPDSIFWKKPAQSSTISDFQIMVANIDKTLSILDGSTQKLLTGKISVATYGVLTGQGSVAGLPTNVGDAQLDGILDRLGVDPSQRAAWRRVIATTTLVVKKGQSFNQLSDNDKAGLFENLETAFDVDLDKELDFREGSVAKMIRDPSHAKDILIEEGILELEMRQGWAENKDTTFHPSSMFLSPDDRAGEAFDQHPLLSTLAAYKRGGAEGLKDLGQDVVQFRVMNKISSGLGKLTKNGLRPDEYLIAAKDLRDEMFAGDWRFLGDAGFVVFAGNLNAPITVNKNGVDQEVRLPDQHRISYQDIRRQSTGLYGDENQTVEDARKNGANAARVRWDAAAGKNPLDLAASDNPDDQELAPFMVESWADNSQSEEAKKEEYVQKQGAIAAENEADNINLNNNDFTYKSVDIYLWRKDQNIPAGFAKGLFGPGADSGTRWNSVLGFLSSQVFDNQNILPALVEFAGDPNKDIGKLIDKLTPSGLSMLDNKLRDLFGTDQLPDGTALAIFGAISTGGIEDFKINGRTVSGLKSLGNDFIAGQVYSYVDSSLGLPRGSAQKLYTAYKAYRAYQVAKATKNFVAAAAARKILKVAVLTVLTDIVLGYYSEQIAKFERDHHLVVGSISAGISAGIGAGLTQGAAAGWAWGVGVFLAMNIFGFNSVELRCTADGFWPRKDPELGGANFQSFSYSNGNWTQSFFGRYFSSTQPITNPMLIAQLDKKRDLNMGLGEFDGLDDASFRGGVIAAARAKARQLVNDLLNARESGFQKITDEDLRPTQMFSLRKEDEKWFQDQGILDKYYGPWASRVNSGFWADPKATSFIHVGY